MYLTDIGLLTYEGLHDPMDPSRPRDKQVQKVAGAFMCFKNIQKFTENWRKDPDISSFESFFYEMDGYTTPVDWLAIIIVRGAAVEDLHTIMDRIESCGEFGTFDRGKLEKIWGEKDVLQRNSGADVVPRWAEHGAPVVAFWLPHNLGSNVTRVLIYETFDTKFFVDFEDLVFRFFGWESGLNLPNHMRHALDIKRDVQDVENGRFS